MNAKANKVAGASSSSIPDAIKVAGASSSSFQAKREQDAPSTLTCAMQPKLRFPEFRDAPGWEEKTLAKICTVNPLNSELPEQFFYIDLESVKAGKLITPKRIRRNEAPSRAQRLLEQGDTIFQVVRPYQRNNYLFNLFESESYVASTGYAQLRAQKSQGFLYHVIHTDGFVNKVIAKCTGSNYPAINSSDLAEIPLEVPSAPEEQQKIADCLSSLDETIAAQSQKLEALKTHKTGLMQQLFPGTPTSPSAAKENADEDVGAPRGALPRLRFPEFQGTPEWEVTSIGKNAEAFSGGTPSTSQREFYGGNIPFIRSAEIGKHATELFLTNLGLKSSASKMVNKGDVLVALYGANSGDVALAKIHGAINQAILCLRPEGDCAFLYHYLSLKKDWIIATYIQGGQGNLSGEIIKSAPFCAPKDLKEQLVIASCLSSLDDLITSQTAKIEALKTHKKGLMQQLFPSLARA